MNPTYSAPPPPAPAPRRSVFRRWWFWVATAVAAVIVIAAVASGGGGDDPTAPAPTGGATEQQSTAEVETPQAPTTQPVTPPADDDPLSDGGWTASDIQVERTQFGTGITARVTNTEAETRSGVFTLTVFSGGQRIHEALGSARDVEAGQTATVTFVGTTEQLPGDPAGYTYEFQSDL